MNRGNLRSLNRQSGQINWAALAALAATVTAAAALMTTLLVFRQMQEQTRRLELNTAIESFWRLDADWNADAMLTVRNVAADGLLAGHPSHELGEVMDFFRDMEFLVEQDALDVTLIAHRFALPLQMYWQASAEVRDELLKRDRGAHQDLEKLVEQLTAVDAERRQEAVQIPSPQQIREFLQGELGHGSCNDDEEETDARRTPL